MTATAATPAAPPAARDRYLDVLRGAALIRVFFYHAFPFAWLTWLPALGVMFALGGSLMATSADRSGIGAVKSRLRRLLPALWLLGAFAVPLMIWHGWSPASGDETPLHWWQLAFWVFPVAEPTGSDWGVAAWEVLWYITTYLWFVLLSPLVLPAFRRAPLLVIATPLVAILVLDGLRVPLDNRAGSVLVDVLTFGACWLLGFAHRDGMLDRIPKRICFAIAAVAIAAGAAWALLLPAEPGNAELDASPGGMALLATGTVLILLRFRPSMAWLSRRPALDRFVTVLNARALTIYLWHNVAIALALAVADYLDWGLDWEWFVLSIAMTAAIVLSFGWVEDLSARRRPQLLPGGRRKPAPVARPLQPSTSA
jgi:peptidoglycan/LPS O-acetylase OafA/YrhL